MADRYSDPDLPQLLPLPVRWHIFCPSTPCAHIGEICKRERTYWRDMQKGVPDSQRCVSSGLLLQAFFFL
eukprot:2340853-Amphidinium_carterae.1